MTAEYRRLRAAEVDAAADLWVDEHQDPNPAGAQHQAWRRQFRALPDLLSHTWVAVADDGALLSIGRYLRVPIHGAEGVPQRACRLSHVFTRASARRRGHASRLLELMLAAMEAEGCLWSILSASEQGRPLYERYGWRPLLLRQVSCGPFDQQRVVAAGYVVRSCDPDLMPGCWSAIQRIHGTYNAGRPLTIVRDEGYWRQVLEQVRWWRSTGSAELLVATPTGEDEHPSAYAVVFVWPGNWSLLEMGALAGRQDALIALLSTIPQWSGEVSIGSRLCLPRDPMLETALAGLTTAVEYQMGGECMVRGVAPSFDARLLDALPAAPGVVLWAPDDF